MSKLVNYLQWYLYIFVEILQKVNIELNTHDALELDTVTKLTYKTFCKI